MHGLQLFTIISSWFSNIYWSRVVVSNWKNNPHVQTRQLSIQVNSIENLSKDHTVTLVIKGIKISFSQVKVVNKIKTKLIINTSINQFEKEMLFIKTTISHRYGNSCLRVWSFARLRGCRRVPACARAFARLSWKGLLSINQLPLIRTNSVALWKFLKLS